MSYKQGKERKRKRNAAENGKVNKTQLSQFLFPYV